MSSQNRNVLFFCFVYTHVLGSFYFFQLHSDDDDESDDAGPEKDKYLVYNVSVIRRLRDDLDVCLLREKFDCQ